MCIPFTKVTLQDLMLQVILSKILNWAIWKHDNSELSVELEQSYTLHNIVNPAIK